MKKTVCFIIVVFFQCNILFSDSWQEQLALGFFSWWGSDLKDRDIIDKTIRDIEKQMEQLGPVERAIQEQGVINYVELMGSYTVDRYLKMSVDYKMPFQDILTDTTLSSELALYGDLWMAYAIERAIKVTFFYYATKVGGHNIPLNTWESICELYFTDNKFMSNYDIARMKRFYSRLISTFAARLP